MTREIVLDTETTGFEPSEGHRIVEIGCVELDGLLPTGNTFHIYINPQRDMPAGAYEVHGLSAEFLSGFPVFEAQVDAFVEFIGDAPLVIHNASFDMKFINAELRAVDRPILPMNRAVDTLAMARKAFPGSPASLDALCRRFGIDNTSRTLHGALLDSELLAEVYLELKGGRQPGFGLDVMAPSAQRSARRGGSGPTKDGHADVEAGTAASFPKRDFPVSEEDAKRHREFLSDVSNPIWAKYRVGANSD